jgi:hypothetical protein
MPRLGRSSAFSDCLRRLVFGAPNRHARRELGRKAPSIRPTDSSRRRVRPCLEPLEDRITPTIFTPTVFTDGNSGSGQNGTLRDAIVAANDDTGTGTDTIQLAQGTYTLNIANTNGHEINSFQGDLNITNTSHTLIIQGIANDAGTPETIIDQTVADRVFQIVNPGTTVIFKNLIIEGGQAQDPGGSGTQPGEGEADGGGILDDGGNVTLSNVILQNNSADATNGFAAKGGGIYVGQGGSLTINDSVIEADGAFGGDDSTSAPNGGDAEGGGVFSLGPMSIANSTVSNNVVTGGSVTNSNAGAAGNAFGGGIYAADSTTITNSTLDGNQVTGGNNNVSVGGNAEGGDLYLAPQGTATLTGCSLLGNTLKGGAGALDIAEIHQGDVGGDAEGGSVFSGGQLTISNCSLSDNSLTGGKGTLQNDQTTITGNIGGSAEGGGVFASGVTNIAFSTLANNKLTGGAGADLSGVYDGYIGGSVAGGGLYFSGQQGAVLTIASSTLSDNSEEGGSNSNGSLAPGAAQGGGAFFSGAGVALVNSTIANNQALGGPGSATNLAAFGGGLYFGINVTATLTNDTVAINSASPIGSGIGEGSGGGIFNYQGSVTLENTLVARNFAIGGTAPDFDGAVSASSNHNLIGIADGSTGFSAANGNLLGSSTNPLNPQLGALANNGGPTQTMALLFGSPAINAGNNSAEVTTGPFDQRGPGFARVVGGTIDIGAFEVQPSTPPPGGSGSGGSSPSPAPPPTLHTPPLLAFIDALLGGVETVNSNGTETVTDKFFGITLFVSTFDSSGDLTSVTIFGINVTLLFELL